MQPCPLIFSSMQSSIRGDWKAELNPVQNLKTLSFYCRARNLVQTIVVEGYFLSQQMAA